MANTIKTKTVLMVVGGIVLTVVAVRLGRKFIEDAQDNKYQACLAGQKEDAKNKVAIRQCPIPQHILKSTAKDAAGATASFSGY